MRIKNRTWTITKRIGKVNVNKVNVKVKVNKVNNKVNDIYSIHSHYRGNHRRGAAAVRPDGLTRMQSSERASERANERLIEQMI